MAHTEDDPPPDKRDSANPPVGPAEADSSPRAKVCKDCGASLKGHWRYKRKGEYYCRSCFRRHVAMKKRRRRLRRKTLMFLAVAGACLLVIIVCLIGDEWRRWLFWTMVPH